MAQTLLFCAAEGVSISQRSSPVARDVAIHFQSTPVLSFCSFNCCPSASASRVEEQKSQSQKGRRLHLRPPLAFVLRQFSFFTFQSFRFHNDDNCVQPLAPKCERRNSPLRLPVVFGKQKQTNKHASKQASKQTPSYCKKKPQTVKTTMTNSYESQHQSN